MLRYRQRIRCRQLTGSVFSYFGVAEPLLEFLQRDDLAVTLLLFFSGLFTPCVRISADFLQVQDAYLQSETAAKGITNIVDLTPIQPGLYLWQGDITTLKCDAIVNAANAGMTGCYIPNHRCIDNAIHTYAGIELRIACEELMERQGYPEPTG